MRGDYNRGTADLEQRMWRADEKFMRETRKRDRTEECKEDSELGNLGWELGDT